jgi:peptidoglycan hydrolase-like protein with peptidoglycan-binding domain
MMTILRSAIPVLAGLLIAGTAAGLFAGPAVAATATARGSAAASIVTHARHGWPVVRQRARGERVVTIQYLLSARGYRIRVDGVFGPGTRANVRNFQKVRHLTADGVVGQRTWSRLILTVRLGSRGAAVRALQHSLRYAYHYKIAVDGIFGRVTRDTVRKFQARYHLVRDGIAGYRTWLALVRHER